jgi:hypothetical protein
VLTDFALNLFSAFRGREVADEEPGRHAHCEGETTAK